MKIEIHDELAGILRVGALTLAKLHPPADGGDALFRSLVEHGESLKNRYQGLTVGQIEGTGETRELYRAVGIDPTKNRPSSEALLRRVIKGKSLYRIHPLVDIFNLVSLSCQLPVGLYDMGKIVGSRVTIRKGLPGWGFDGIRKDRVNVGGRLCTVDEQGPFGSPTSDSLRTCIESDVNRALAIFFQHQGGEDGRLKKALEMAQNLCEQHLGAAAEPPLILES